MSHKTPEMAGDVVKALVERAHATDLLREKALTETVAESTAWTLHSGRTATARDGDGLLSFTALFPKAKAPAHSAEKAVAAPVAYAATVLRSTQDQDAWLITRCEDQGIKIWANGSLIVDRAPGRSAQYNPIVFGHVWSSQDLVDTQSPKFLG